VSPNPEVRFSMVAATLPKPSVKPWSGVAEGRSGLLCFFGPGFPCTSTPSLIR
jgi:hypothetical protein